MAPSPLKLFTAPTITRRIRLSLLAELFGRFTHLLPNKYCLPKPCADNESYFDVLAQTLEQPSDLPDSLFHALHEIEAAAAALLAAPENDPSSDPADTESTRLRQAIQLWLSSHPESNNPPIHESAVPLPASINPPIHESTNPSVLAPPTPHSGVPIENQNSKFKNASLPHSDTPSLQHLAAPKSDEGGSTTPHSDAAAFSRLARLSRAEYDRARKAEAARLGIRKETLDAEVAKLRSQFNDDAQAQSIIALRLTPIEPWPEPVNGAEVLHQVTDRFNLHVVLPLGAPHAIALFVAHIHAFEAFAHSPRLNLTSAFHQCGKTTTLDLIHVMVPRPLRTENLRAAVIFRVVDWASPTVLLDELDTYLPRAEELRGLLNAGHKRGACAYRCEGEGNAVRAFNAFAPAVLSGIGPLPATLHDRSIVILLEQAKPEQIQVRFDSRKVEVETILGQKLARWAKDNFPALQACDPKMPPGAYNRLADNWRPLFAIAEVAGGDWPRLALEAFTALTKVRTESPPSLTKNFSLQPSAFSLLSDIRQVFTKTGATRIASKQLVEALCGLADRPWLETCPGNKPITGSWLAHQLKHFGVNSRNVRLNGHQTKGYVLKDFVKAFATLAS